MMWGRECLTIGRMPGEGCKISSAPQNETLYMLDVQGQKYGALAESNSS